MNIGDVWGAGKAVSSKPVPEASPSTRKSLQESALLIHHKIIAMHDEYDDEETMLDNERLQSTTGLSDKAWKVVMGLCNITEEHIGVLNTERLYQVADKLLDMTNKDWYNMIRTKSCMFKTRLS